MDTSTIVNWGTIAIWIVGIAGYVGKLLRGETRMPLKLKNILNSNWLLGTVLVAGLIGSSLQIYLRHTQTRLYTTMTAKNADLERENKELSDKLIAALSLPSPAQQITGDQAKRLIRRLGDLYSKQHPSGTVDEKQAWVNAELKKDGYQFQFTYAPHYQGAGGGTIGQHKKQAGNVTPDGNDPCSLGNLYVDGFTAINTEKGIATSGKIPCTHVKGMTQFGGKEGISLNEREPAQGNSNSTSAPDTSKPQPSQ